MSEHTSTSPEETEQVAGSLQAAILACTENLIGYDMLIGVITETAVRVIAVGLIGLNFPLDKLLTAPILESAEPDLYGVFTLQGGEAVPTEGGDPFQVVVADVIMVKDLYPTLPRKFRIVGEESGAYGTTDLSEAEDFPAWLP